LLKENRRLTSSNGRLQRCLLEQRRERHKVLKELVALQLALRRQERSEQHNPWDNSCMPVAQPKLRVRPIPSPWVGE
jgi:hypothetical protein